MATKKTVIKHSAVIQVTHKVSLLEQHLYNVLLAEAFNELDVKKEIYSIKISTIREYIPSILSVRQLKKMLTNLHKIEIQYNIFGKDKNKKWRQKEWGIFSFLSGATIGQFNKWCYFSFDPQLIPFLKNPTMYSKIDLELQKRYKGGKLGWNLYELCYDYKRSISKEAGRTPAMTIDKLKKYAGIDSGKYKEYKRLNEKIILPAIKEINEQTDIHIETVIKRIGREISHISFHITDKTDYSNEPPLIPLTGNPGIPEDDIKRARKKYSEEAIDEAIQCCREIDNPISQGAVFSAALSHSYVSKKTKKLNRSKRRIEADKKEVEAKAKKEKELKEKQEDEDYEAEELYREAGSRQVAFDLCLDSMIPDLKGLHDKLDKQVRQKFKITAGEFFLTNATFKEVRVLFMDELIKFLKER